MLPGGRQAWVRIGTRHRLTNEGRPPPAAGHVYRSAGRPEIMESPGPDTARLAWKIAAVRFGSFVVVGASSPNRQTTGVAGRLYRPTDGGRGRFRAGASQVATSGWPSRTGYPRRALDGRFRLCEAGPSIAQSSASLADKPCLARGGQCPWHRPDRGSAKMDLELSAVPPRSLLMGEVDGDRRRDPCVVDGSTCAATSTVAACPSNGKGIAGRRGKGHAPARRRRRRRQGGLASGGGGPALPHRVGPWKESFGRAGDIPLLGDVDGDGPADLCVRRGHRFL